jgi:hypothetical protein
MPVKRSERFLTSKQEIMDYCGITNYTFTKFIKAGMPARYEDGRWYASSSVIDKWWDQWTLVLSMNIIDSVPPDAEPTRTANGG